MSSRWILCLALLAVPASVTAQQARDSVVLKEIVVTANRTPTPARNVGSATDIIDSLERDHRQIRSVQDALRLLPGTNMVSTGAPGGTTSTFFRGTNSTQTLLLIDGIRANDGNASPQSILGGIDLTPNDRLEIVRGPQGTLYGGAAVGGVISLFTPQGRGPARLNAQVEAGSFSTYRAQAGIAGSSGRLGYTLSGSFINTNNQLPNNEYDQRGQQARLDYQWSDKFRTGVTFRGMQQHYVSPGDIRTTNPTPVSKTDFENNLGTAFAEVSPVREWSSRLTAGYQEYFIKGLSSYYGDESISKLSYNRWVADWQNRITPVNAVEFVAGLNGEWATVYDGNDGRDERLKAAYGQVRVDVTQAFSITGGLRLDDYSTFGSAVTGRVTGAYFVASSSTKLRASYGSGFMPPALSSRYGGPFQRANPDIKPERSRGWDAGIDQFVFQGRGVIGVTVFGNTLRDLIGFESAPYPDLGRSINIARAKTSGVELSSRFEVGGLDARVSYTYLKATDESATDPAEERLIRRPRHTVSADANYGIGTRGRLGAGVIYAANREDTDFSVFPSPRVNPGDYADVRIYGELTLVRGMRLQGRLENLFDNRYEDVYGYPALGRRFLVSVALDH